MDYTEFDEKQILAANQILNRALVERDTTALETLLDPAFIAIHITGHEQTKADWLRQITSGGMTYHHIEEVSVALSFSEDSAVLVTRNRVTATIYGSQATWPMESTTVYTYKDGSWSIQRSAATTY
jgi:hypothetical protein